MKYSILIIGCFLLGAAFLLSGCGKNNETGAAPIDNESIVSTTPLQSAYLFCANQEYTVQIQYDEKTLRGNVYCVFPDGSDCLAADFMNGTCTTELAAERARLEEEAGARLVDISDQDILLRYCEQIAEPVCGVDGRTYTNECVAELFNTEIIHEGACDGPQATRPLGEELTGETRPGETASGAEQPSDRDIPSARPGTPTNDQTPRQGAEDPTWVGGLISIVMNDTQMTNVSLERCTYGNNQYYYQTGEFSVLYDSAGTSRCYPSHDINGLCPSWFTKGEGSCKTIWKKE